ncbi:hypothetical protein FRC20_009888 [Serendipita sp. 405]|nr:hypothetical protein FRC15_010500 [Serendipita sp. 397]KAG8796747.1 hypothetical protein FRC16_009507 [Serendipita sp. 398]KAG8831235.1 hypothetical protein FRC18_006933 [Serendipita sp. 400]KAG8865092.1 hypothetical protein FRC20_009888 [Serendipita sp. 405]
MVVQQQDRKLFWSRARQGGGEGIQHGSHHGALAEAHSRELLNHWISSGPRPPLPLLLCGHTSQVHSILQAAVNSDPELGYATANRLVSPQLYWRYSGRCRVWS